MTDLCPTCRKPLGEQVRVLVDLESNIAILDGQALFLSPKQAEILECLASAMPLKVHKEELFRNLYQLEQEDPDQKIVDVFICHLRKALQTTGYRIETLWGTGYRLVRIERDAA